MLKVRTFYIAEKNHALWKKWVAYCVKLGVSYSRRLMELVKKDLEENCER